MLDLRHVAGRIYSVKVGFVFFLFGRVVHRIKRDNFTSILNDLKHARQSNFAFSLMITLISILNRNLLIFQASALLNKILNLLALLIATNNRQQQAQVNRKCQYFDHNATLNKFRRSKLFVNRRGQDIQKNLKLMFQLLYFAKKIIQ